MSTLTHIILTLFSRLRHPESFNCVMQVPSSPKVCVYSLDSPSLSPSLSPPPIPIIPAPSVASEIGDVSHESGRMDGASDAHDPGGSNVQSESQEPSTSTEVIDPNEVPTVESQQEDVSPAVDAACAVEGVDNSEAPIEDDSEETESQEPEELLVPYDISLLHQTLSFLIQLTDPTKYALCSFLIVASMWLVSTMASPPSTFCLR